MGILIAMRLNRVQGKSHRARWHLRCSARAIVEPLERRYYGNERYRERERERRTRRPGDGLGSQIGPEPGGGDIALGPGPHVGRGPRDYRRSDERILEDVCQWLQDDPRVDVTLEGSVGDRRARRLAEDIASNVPGVRDVFNRLRVAAGRRSA